MLSENELIYRIALQNLPHLGDATAKKLMERLGSAEAIFSAKKKELLAIEGIGVHKIQYVGDASYIDEAEKEWQFAKQNGIDIWCYDDLNYPSLLKHCIDGPIVLFNRGNIDLKAKKNNQHCWNTKNNFLWYTVL